MDPAFSNIYGLAPQSAVVPLESIHEIEQRSVRFKHFGMICMCMLLPRSRHNYSISTSTF
jgi:hypothetical protein